MKKYLHLTLLLFFIAALSGLILSVVNDFTKDKIAAVKEAKVNDGIQVLFEDAVSNEIVASNQGAIVEVREVFSDEEKNTRIGYVFVINAPKSYSGKLQILVGIDTDGKVVGNSYLNMPETPGIGNRARDEAWFNQQFVNLGLENGQFDKDIDKISGASKTTTSVINGVKLALEYYHNHLSEGDANE